jgi:uncharacterized protein (TIGR02466 family)
MLLWRSGHLNLRVNDKMLECLDLWPTKLLKKELMSFKTPNQGLLKLIESWDKENRSLTTDYRDHNPFEIDAPATNWLREEVNQTVIEYLQSIKINYAVNWQIHGWSNLNRRGDYHDPHNHPRSYLSGTYYVKVPKAIDAEFNRSDVRPNSITFYDPRTGFNMQSIKNDPYVDPEYTVFPTPGLLMLWPSSLMHFVHPNLTKETRVSISFNVILKWSDEYLPEQ